MQGFEVFKQDFRLALFLLALSIYALWGSPTPDTPSIYEFTIGALLLGAIGFAALAKSQQIPAKPSGWQSSAWLLWLYGLSIPMIIALGQEPSAKIIARDVIGFIFLCLPLFMYSFFHNKTVRQKYLLPVCLLIGVLFSLRVLMPDFSFFAATDELLYLANSPLVIFSLLFFVSFGLQKIFDQINVQNVLFTLITFGFAVIFLLAMFVDVQRAPLSVLAITLAFLFVVGLVKAPRKVIIPVIMIVILTFIFDDFLLAAYQDMAIKTSRVGFNMRLQEWQAVWESASHSWIVILFGHGWGSSFASPAVGGLHVTYTHSLLSYMFFKTGFIGLVLTLIYLAFIFEKLLRLVFIDPVIANALLWPLLIPVLLYASHKSFDFGLLLVLILVMAKKTDNKEPYKHHEQTLRSDHKPDISA